MSVMPEGEKNWGCQKYRFMNTRQIDIFFKISNSQQCWLSHTFCKICDREIVLALNKAVSKAPVWCLSTERNN